MNGNGIQKGEKSIYLYIQSKIYWTYIYESNTNEFSQTVEQQQDYNRYNHVHLSVGIEFLISFDNKINSLSMLLSRYSDTEIQDANFANMFELKHI